MRLKHIAMVVGGVSLGLFLWTRCWTTEHSDHKGEGGHPRQPLHWATPIPPSYDPRPTPRKIDSYSLFESGDEISEKALEAAGLPHSSGSLVKEIYQDVLVDIHKDIASRVVPQTAPTDQEGVHTFAIKGDPEKSEIYIEQIRQKFANEFGGRAADKLLLGLRRSMSHGKFGRNDAVITIEKKGGDGFHSRIVIEYFDVDSGKLAEEWQATEKELKREYVDVFNDVLSASGMENDR